MKYAQRAKEVLDIEIAGLQKVRNGLGAEFGRALEVLLKSVSEGGKIVVVGVGKNLPVGQKIASTLTSTGSPAVFLHPNDAMHGEIGILLEGDVVVALSYSGESEELLNLLPLIKRKGLPIIAITGSRENSLARLCDEVILITIDLEACPFNLAPTTSTTVTLAVGDAVAMVLLEARGFQKEDYAKLHPGGAIGRTLLLRASDIMRTGERLACVKQNAKVKDAVVAMTNAKSGAVAVVDGHHKVVGIFTDGDLRRKLTAIPDLMNHDMAEVMSRNPATLPTDALAVDVLATFQKHNFDDLIVVDKKGCLAGLVDIQDLPKFKIL